MQQSMLTVSHHCSLCGSLLTFIRIECNSTSYVIIFIIHSLGTKSISAKVRQSSGGLSQYIQYVYDPGQKVWAALMSSICRSLWLCGWGGLDGQMGQQLFSLLLVSSISYYTCQNVNFRCNFHKKKIHLLWKCEC